MPLQPDPARLLAATWLITLLQNFSYLFVSAAQDRQIHLSSYSSLHSSLPCFEAIRALPASIVVRCTQRVKGLPLVAMGSQQHSKGEVVVSWIRESSTIMVWQPQEEAGRRLTEAVRSSRAHLLLLCQQSIFPSDIGKASLTRLSSNIICASCNIPIDDDYCILSFFISFNIRADASERQLLGLHSPD